MSMKQQPREAILLWQHNYIPIKQWDVFKYLQPTFPFLLLYGTNPGVFTFVLVCLSMLIRHLISNTLKAILAHNQLEKNKVLHKHAGLQIHTQANI